jgi:hypothetical protein
MSVKTARRIRSFLPQVEPAAALAFQLHLSTERRPPRLADPVYDRFGEGFRMADLKSAKTLPDALGHAQ